MMNSYALATIFVACLAAGTNCETSTFPDELSRHDYDDLDEYLRNEPNYGGLEGYLASIEYDLDYLGAGAKRAGQAILALRDVKECNEQVLSLLVKVRASEKDYIAKEDTATKLSAPLASRATKICTEYIEKPVGDKYAELIADPKLAKLLHLLRSAYKRNNLKDSVDPYKVLSYIGFMKAFIEKDDEAPIAGNRANFDSLFKANIVEPCEKLTSGLKDLYNQARQIPEFASRWETFVGHRSKPFRAIIWAYQSCEKLLSLNEREKTHLFKGM